MKVLITGGHFSPAYTIIKELKKRGAEVAIVGRRFALEGDKAESFEYIVSQKENIPFYELKTGRVQRKFTAKTIPSLVKIPLGLVDAARLVSKIRPDVVVTFGGYLGFPVAYAAKFLGIPVVLHEQTQKAGAAAKYISRVAKKVCVSFESSLSEFPKNKVVWTGNPVREEVFAVDKKLDLPEGKVIYVTGGSTGSHFINSVIGEILPTLLEKYVVIHQTGDSREYEDFEKLEEVRKSLGEKERKRYILKKFVFPDEVGFVLKNADLVVSRAGANTVSEIMALGKVSFLIPLPHGQSGEQLANAKLIKSAGAGDYIEQKDATAKEVLEKIDEIFANFNEYEKNTKHLEKYTIENSAEKIADVIEGAYGKKNG